MSTSEPKEMTVLFADVAGSVELYSALGDVKAHKMVLRCLERMSVLVEKNRGRVADTIGDEIMCTFEKADCALKAACEIQMELQSKYHEELDVRIGVHSGPTYMDNDYLFGDTVNIAARVVALAKAGQIMLSEHTCERLPYKDRSRTRYFSQVFIKGKRDPYVIHQAILDHEDETRFTSHSGTRPADRRLRKTRVTLRYADTETIISEGSEFLLGRGAQCDLKINSDAVSRIHAALECNCGKLVITDRSTNGTFIRTESGKRDSDNKEFFIRHGSWTTTSGGVLCLGQAIKPQGENLIHFSCTGSDQI